MRNRLKGPIWRLFGKIQNLVKFKIGLKIKNWVKFKIGKIKKSV